jgi:flagellin
MSLNIISNYAANVAHRYLEQNETMAASWAGKLASGQRVLSAKDDAAAMAIGSRMQSEVNALKQASVNAGQASSMAQIADGALARVTDVLTRMKTLAVQAGSDQLSSTERGFLNTEYTGLRSEIDRIAGDTEFNGQKLLSGSNTVAISAVGANVTTTSGIIGVKFGNSNAVSTSGQAFTIAYDTSTDKFTVTTGATAQLSSSVSAAPGTGQTTDVYFSSFDLTLTLSSAFAPGTAIAASNTFTATASASNSVTYSFKVGTGAVAAEDEVAVTFNKGSSTALAAATATTFDTGDVTTKANADTAITDISSILNKVNTYRASLGASLNRLGYATANLATATENAESARSQLLDLDVASAMTSFTSSQVLVQSGVAMLAQANKLPENLMRLFQ